MVSSDSYPALWKPNNGCLSSSCHFSWRQLSSFFFKWGWRSKPLIANLVTNTDKITITINKNTNTNTNKYTKINSITWKWTTDCSIKRMMRNPMPIVSYQEERVRRWEGGWGVCRTCKAFLSFYFRNKIWILAKFRNKKVDFWAKNNGHQNFT